MDEQRLADVLVTWLGAAGTLSYLVHILRNPSRSFLERRAALLLATLSVLLVVRAFSWLDPASHGWRLVTFVPSTLLPLAMCLFAEGLLRRHLPLWLKVLGAGTTAVFLAANLVLSVFPAGDRGAWHAMMTYPFPAAMLAVMAALGWVCLTRPRRTLSRAENDLVDGCIVVTLVALPLVASDFGGLGAVFPNRMGGVGALLFVYTLVRMTQFRKRRRWLPLDLAWLVVKGALATAALLALTAPAGRAPWAHALSVAMALVLLFGVWDRLRELGALRRERGLLRWLAHAPCDSLEAFLRALRHYPLTADHVHLGPAELAGYDADRLLAVFRGRSICSAGQLRPMLGAARGAELDGAEQMLDLLQKHETTHACLLAADPPHLLLVNLPEMAGTQEAELELQVIQRQGSLAAAMERGRLPAPPREPARA